MFSSLRGKALASIIVVGSLSAFLTAGTYALFSTTATSAGNLFSTGTVSLGSSNPGRPRPWPT